MSYYSEHRGQLVAEVMRMAKKRDIKEAEGKEFKLSLAGSFFWVEFLRELGIDLGVQRPHYIDVNRFNEGMNDAIDIRYKRECQYALVNWYKQHTSKQLIELFNFDERHFAIMKIEF